MLWHPDLDEIIDMGETRERRISIPENLIPLIDSVDSLGWHDCSRAYYINHGERNDTNLVFITLAGGGILELNGVIYPIVPGTITVIPNNVKTVYYTAPGENHWEFYWMHVRGVNVSNIFRRLYQSRNYRYPVRDTTGYTRIFEEILNTRSEGSALALEVSQKISVLLHKIIEEIISQRILPKDDNDFVKKIRQYIEKHYMTNITIEELASHMFMTPENIIRTFKKYTDCTLHAYLKKHRITVACQLLHTTDLSVREVARRVGYRSASSFAAEFRSLKGISPTQFRKQSPCRE